LERAVIVAKEIHVIIGAFGYSGKYIAKHLLDADCEVRTLTNSINRANHFGDKVKVYPYISLFFLC
jgi:NADH dehydrogenase